MQAESCSIGVSPLRRQPGRSSAMTKRTVFATAAAAFAVSTFAAAAHADYTCAGTNACKGQSACKTAAAACKGQNACKSASNACKGQNACKGKGWVSVGSTIECSVLQQNPPK